SPRHGYAHPSASVAPLPPLGHLSLNSDPPALSPGGQEVDGGEPNLLGDPGHATSCRRNRWAGGLCRSPPARPSEGIVDAGKDRDALVAIADIDIAHDEGMGDAAEANAAGVVEVVDRRIRHAVEDLTGVDEGRRLEGQGLREKIEVEDA